ncbi:protocadherin-17-like [Haliotis asinina]|uniref:protocadherin-17-like n=1 Tax=Haliotis asinina TaxID=109174 RepID=UPI003531AF80
MNPRSTCCNKSAPTQIQVMAARPSIPTLTTLTWVLLVHVQLTIQATLPPSKNNLYAPVFINPEVQRTIPETYPTGSNIVTLTATDNDAMPPNNEVVYELVGDAVQLYYFEIGSSTGDIRLKHSLTSDPIRRNQFRLTVQATDKGAKPLSSAQPATVTINVVRNHAAPVFAPRP